MPQSAKAATSLVPNQMNRQRDPEHEETIIPVHAESISVDRQEIEKGTIRVMIQTKTRAHPVDENLTHTRVEIERIPINRIVKTAPSMRTEGDTTIIPVVEEIVVVERRLVLKEEIILRRVQNTERYQDTVTLREQEAVIERTERSTSESASNDEPITRKVGDDYMTTETIVAIYDSEANATAAVSELTRLGIPPSAITRHGRNRVTTGLEATEAPVRERSFWDKLFGGAPENMHDTMVYDRSLESGSTLVMVQAEQRYIADVMEILERYDPINIDERAASYNLGQTMAANRPITPAARAEPVSGSRDEQTMQLAEETLAVGKRAINRGTTRVRRYVVETPVEEQVNLRRESVSVERRPVAVARPVTDATFTEKVVEVTEIEEQPVVSKQAQIKEEVVIHKDAAERIETVRDTVRREEVEVTKEPATGSTAANVGRSSDPVTKK
jgi:uncharacterized protein (TIGR02271 family)